MNQTESVTLLTAAVLSCDNIIAAALDTAICQHLQLSRMKLQLTCSLLLAATLVIDAKPFDKFWEDCSELILAAHRMMVAKLTGLNISR